MKCTLLLVLAAILPPVAWCQTPQLLAVWGSSGSAPFYFEHPSGVAVDALGNVYVADFAGSCVLAFTSGGTLVRTYGSPVSDTLRGPSKIAFAADGTMYVADGSACGIAMWKGGMYQGWFGGCGKGDGQLYYSWGVAVAGDKVYVSDTANHRILVFTTAGAYLSQWPTGDLCEGLAVDGGGNLYVAEYGGHIDVFSPAGVLLSTIGSQGSGPGQLNVPYDVALDGQGHVYVADAYNHRIEVFTTSGAYVTAWGVRGSDPGQFIQPRGVAIDATGRIYVADTWNNRIQVFASLTTPARTTSWGSLKARYH